jgi:murein L,D-transpeptidase YcbB/YkuD
VDLLLSDIFLTYGAQVALGKTKLRRLDADWFVQQQRADLVEVLQQAVTENRIAETVKSLPPQHPGYAKLRDALVRYRHLAARGGWPTIPEGGALRPGDHDARVPQLRARLQVTGEFTAPPAPSGRSRRPARVPAGDPTFYDPALVRAAKKFQQRHGLQLDGVIGGNSLAALNVSVETRVQQVMVNMHRWRALPPNLGARHIDVNIPDFTLSVSEHDHPVLTMKVVVGKMLEEHSTPTFSAQMTYLVLNPYWYVPKNIAEKELFPQSRKDPHYFAKNNFVLRRVAVNEKKTADPNAVADAPPSAKTYQYLLRQEPGPKNALGRVKFMFPNDYGVYLHDTPAKELFRRVVRTFSHGCIRIEKPIELAEYLLRDSGQWPRDAILAKLEEQKQKTVWLPEALPVYIQYWTAWVDDDGVTQFRNDIYGYDNVPGAQLPVKTPQPQPAASAPEVHPSSPREQSPPAPAPAETSVEPRRQDPEPSVVN